MADLSTITLPSGTTYNLKDAFARQAIEDITGGVTGAMHYLGTSTTALEDGSTTSTLVIDGETKTFGTDEAGAVVIYGESEYVWNGSKWNEFGSTGSLKALAFKDNASASYTPGGNVSQPTFSGDELTSIGSFTPSGSVTISKGTGTANYTPEGTVSTPTFSGTAGSVSVTTSGAVTAVSGSVNTTASGGVDIKPAGTVSQPSFTGEELTSTGNFTPSGSVTISKGTGTANYTPEGSVSTPTITVTPDTTTVNSITAVGTLPSATMPVFSATVSNENLTLGWTAGSFSAGTLPTKGSNTTVVTGIKSASSTQPTFTGTGAELKGSFAGTAGNVSVTGTPEGTVSQPTFTGTQKYLHLSTTKDTVTSTGNFTPEGTVSQPSFTGTGVDLEADFSGASGSVSVKGTPSGTVSKPSFTGTQTTITVS